MRENRQDLPQIFAGICRGGYRRDTGGIWNLSYAQLYLSERSWSTLALGKAEKEFLDLSLLRQGIGLSGDDLSDIRITGREKIRKVITIENLTTFFRWQEENALIIYLGGYHNKVRRRLLKEIYETTAGCGVPAFWRH